MKVNIIDSKNETEERHIKLYNEIFPEIVMIRNTYIDEDREWASCIVKYSEDEYPEQTPPAGRTGKSHNNILKMNSKHNKGKR